MMQSSDYYLDLYTFSIEELQELLKNGRLLPSQQILLEDMKLWITAVVPLVPKVIQY